MTNTNTMSTMNNTNNMNNIKYIYSKSGEKLYLEVAKDLPIIDYHCHLSPKEIYEDLPFDNIGQMWLDGDHYKWRLMRANNIDEKYITGKASHKEKFLEYAKAIENSPGNPLYHWSHMELKQFFHIDLELNQENADLIWEKANDYIKREKLSPRKLIEQAKVTYIGTTDDIIDDLKYHRLLKEDKSFKTLVMPTFRTDNVMLIRNKGYKEYIEKLSKVSEIEISDLDSLSQALVNRMDFFAESGATMSDVGIQYFPDADFTYDIANKVFKDTLAGKDVEDKNYFKFLGYLYVFLSKEYKKRDITQQIHTGVLRNANTRMFEEIGPDAGFDVSANGLDARALANLLDKMDQDDNLAPSILYILNPSSYYQALTVAGAFRKVLFGAAWWHMDHLDGIEENLRKVASLTSLGMTLGMLTDSRSFLSYARHDYFRRILSSVLGKWVDQGEYSYEAAKKVVYNLSYGNVVKKVKIS